MQYETAREAQSRQRAEQRVQGQGRRPALDADSQNNLAVNDNNQTFAKAIGVSQGPLDEGDQRAALFNIDVARRRNTHREDDIEIPKLKAQFMARSQA